jgi:hypothetical protein
MKLRKTIAALLVLIFALVALPTLFLRSVSVTYLNPDFYEGEVIDQTYEYIVGFISDEVAKEDDVKDYFVQEDIEAMIRKSVSANLMQDLVKDFTAQLKGLSDGRKTDSIVISLLPIKDNMGLVADDIAQKVVENIPTCDLVEEDEAVEMEYIDGKPVCIPEGFDSEDVVKSVKHEIEKELNNVIPGEFTLELSPETEGQATIKQVLSFVDYLQLILPLFMLVFLLLMALFVYSPYSTISKFTGAALFLAGVFGLAASQLIKQIPSLSITIGNFPDLLVEELSYLTEIYSFFLGFVVDKMGLYSIYLLGMGIVIILFGLYLHHFHEHTRENSR